MVSIILLRIIVNVKKTVELMLLGLIIEHLMVAYLMIVWFKLKNTKENSSQ